MFATGFARQCLPDFRGFVLIGLKRLDTVSRAATIHTDTGALTITLVDPAHRKEPTDFQLDIFTRHEHL